MSPADVVIDDSELPFMGGYGADDDDQEAERLRTLCDCTNGYAETAGLLLPAAGAVVYGLAGHPYVDVPTLVPMALTGAYGILSVMMGAENRSSRIGLLLRARHAKGPGDYHARAGRALRRSQLATYAKHTLLAMGVLLAAQEGCEAVYHGVLERPERGLEYNANTGRAP